MPSDEKIFGERMGMVNLYFCKSCRAGTLCLLLDSGVTPFGIACPKCQAVECFSSMYVLRELAPFRLTRKLEIDHAFFRPTCSYVLGECTKRNSEDRRFDVNTLYNQWMQHCRNGGLAHSSLEEALDNRNSLNFEGLDRKGSIELLEFHYKDR